MTDLEAPRSRSPRRRGLGRGLDALLAGTPTVDDGHEGGSILVEIDPNSIAPNPEQPRRNFDENTLATLAESIRTHGLLQPIVVERSRVGYTLVAGERRLRAAVLAGASAVAAIVRPASESARQSLELALTENLNREDLNPMEEAAAYARLADTFGLSHEAIGLRLGRARPTISNAIRLLGLTPSVQEAVASGRILPSHGRALVALPNPRDQEEMAREVERSGMGTNALEGLVQDRLTRSRAAHQIRAATRPAGLAPDDEAVRRGLEEAIGLPVTLQRKRHGGYVTIAFASDDDLAAFYTRIGGPPL